jgi:hypothetical protein
MTDFQNEFEGLLEDKKEIQETLKTQMNNFAEEIKRGLGDEIKRELLNPTFKTIKKTKKEKIKEKINLLKQQLSNYFFPENNEHYLP